MSYNYFQISKKSDYAIRALLVLTESGPEQTINVKRLASIQSIPQRFLEIILNELKQGSFVISTRGKTGGYLLARPADEISKIGRAHV